MEEEPKNRMTLTRVFVHILANLRGLLASPVFGPDEKFVLDQLLATITVLDDIACEVGDALCIDILDDFSYAVRHINLANFKAESALIEVQPKIDALLTTANE